MTEPITKTTIGTRTYAGIEAKLIERHMFLETGKFVVGVIIYLLVIIALIINSVSGKTIDTAILGYIIAGNSFFMASVKIKNIKEIINLGNP